MPFGHSAGPTRAYAYGARVVAGADAARAEMRARDLLWNELVALDREYRERRDARCDLFLGIDRAGHDRRREALAADFRAAKAVGDDARMRDLRATEHSWREARKPAYADPEVKADLAALDAGIQARAKGACAASPLWWCNRDAVRAAWLQHRRDPIPLRFHRAGDGSTLAVRRSGGWDADALLRGAHAERGYVRLAAADPLAWSSPARAERRRRCVTRLRLWIATAPDGAARLMDLEVHLHRPLPAGGTVRQVTVARESLADGARWSVIFLVAMPDRGDARPPRSGTVALDLGWRRRASGMRACAWTDDAGRSGELLLPEGWLRERAKVDGIRSARDRDFDEARARLADWLRTHREAAPEWLREETATLARWRACGRLAAATLRWRERRFDGDAAIYEDMERWRRHDLHHWRYGANLLDQLIARRREAYRVFAAGLARAYGTVAIEDAAWAEMARKPRRGSKAADPATQAERAIEDAAREHRHWLAPSALELAIKNAVGREGGVVVEHPAPHTTSTCSACGERNLVDGVKLFHRCAHCGREWDIDLNATRNLLAQTDAAS